MQSFPSLRFYSLQPDVICQTTDTGLVHRAVCLFTPQPFDSAYCACPRKDGQAKLTWAAGYMRRWFTRGC